MDVAIKKVSLRDGQDRFILVNVMTRDVVTVHDVSEVTMRRFLLAHGASDSILDECFSLAKAKFGEVRSRVSVPESDAQETMGDDDLLFELGLGDSD